MMLLILTHLDGQNVGKSVKMPGTKSSFYHLGTTILYLWCDGEKMIKEHFPTHSSSLKKCWPTVFKRKFFQWGFIHCIFCVDNICCFFLHLEEWYYNLYEWRYEQQHTPPLLGFLTNACRCADEFKNSMGFLQGLRLMTWTTKSSIRGNHWVPLGCKALLGSVKQYFWEIYVRDHPYITSAHFWTFSDPRTSYSL